MCNFKISLLVSSAAHSRLKNLSTAVNATRRATKILLRRVNQLIKVNFFGRKPPDVAPVLNKQLQLKRVTDGT